MLSISLRVCLSVCVHNKEKKRSRLIVFCFLFVFIFLLSSHSLCSALWWFLMCHTIAAIVSSICLPILPVPLLFPFRSMCCKHKLTHTRTQALHHRKIIRINYLEAAWCGCWCLVLALSTYLLYPVWPNPNMCPNPSTEQERANGRMRLREWMRGKNTRQLTRTVFGSLLAPGTWHIIWCTSLVYFNNSNTPGLRTHNFSHFICSSSCKSHRVHMRRGKEATQSL